MPDLEDHMTAERRPAADGEFGALSLKIADHDGREWAVSMPYPDEADEGDIDAALRRLRAALDVLVGE